MAANSGMYNRPLENPQEDNVEQGFLAFVLQCLEGIKEKYVPLQSVTLVYLRLVLKQNQVGLNTVI